MGLGSIQISFEEESILKRLTLILLTVIITCPAGALAQTRRRGSTQKSTPPTSLHTTVIRNQAAARVGDQIKHITRFIYLLGGVAKDLAVQDDAVRRNEATPAILQQNQANKATVKASISRVREGLDKLELDFRVTPELQPYYTKLAGTAAAAAAAEQQAAANQVDAAGRSLLNVVNRLTDVLLEMR